MKAVPRFKKIIDKEFQYAFIMKQVLFLLFTLGLLVVGLILYNKYNLKNNFLTKMPTDTEVARIAVEKNIDPNSAEYGLLYYTESKVLTASELLMRPFVVVCIFNCLLLVLFNIFISHRIVGPIFSIKRTLKRRLAGEPDLSIKLRQRDHFHELADLINRNLNR